MGKVGITAILKTQLELANATIRELTLRLESVTKTEEERAEQEKRREEERKARGSDGGEGNYGHLPGSSSRQVGEAVTTLIFRQFLHPDNDIRRILHKLVRFQSAVLTATTEYHINVY